VIAPSSSPNHQVDAPCRRSPTASREGQRNPSSAFQQRRPAAITARSNLGGGIGAKAVRGPARRSVGRGSDRAPVRTTDPERPATIGMTRSGPPPVEPRARDAGGPRQPAGLPPRGQEHEEIEPEAAGAPASLSMTTEEKGEDEAGKQGQQSPIGQFEAGQVGGHIRGSGLYQDPRVLSLQTSRVRTAGCRGGPVGDGVAGPARGGATYPGGSNSGWVTMRPRAAISGDQGTLGHPVHLRQQPTGESQRRTQQATGMSEARIGHTGRTAQGEDTKSHRRHPAPVDQRRGGGRPRNGALSGPDRAAPCPGRRGGGGGRGMGEEQRTGQRQREEGGADVINPWVRAQSAERFRGRRGGQGTERAPHLRNDLLDSRTVTRIMKDQGGAREAVHTIGKRFCVGRNPCRAAPPKYNPNERP